MIILHIIIAISSLFIISATLLQPAKRMLMAGYGLVGGTLLSGVLLVVETPSHMAQVCTSGLIYLAIASLGLIVAHVRLARLDVSARG